MALIDREADSPYRVLVIDDEPVNLQVIIQQLTSLHAEVDTALSSEWIVACIDQLHEYDLIIADLMMPGLSGFELCRLIRKRYTLDELPILIMTASNFEDTIVTAFRAGANDYIPKPIRRNELVSRVHTLILMRRAVVEVRNNSAELARLNEELKELNANLEERIQLRTLELERANEMLQAHNQELHRLESARRMLLSDVSHELRTPMTAIQGYTEAILSGLVEDPSEQQRYLQKVLLKSRALNRLIQDLFELSRLESRRTEMIFEIIPLAKFISQIKDKYSLDVMQVGLEYHFESMCAQEREDDYQVVVDMDRIIQVLTNLVFNSIKYTAPGGWVKISCELDMEARTHDSLGNLVINVADNGIGIKPEALPYVFDRFYREKRSDEAKLYEGSGIGLAIAKSIVEYHEGSISVDSIVGQGATFSVSLPLYQIDE